MSLLGITLFCVLTAVGSLPDRECFLAGSFCRLRLSAARQDLTWTSEQPAQHIYTVHVWWPDDASDAEEAWDQEVPMNMSFEECEPR